MCTVVNVSCVENMYILFLFTEALLKKALSA